jgi:hypothetical protein
MKEIILSVCCACVSATSAVAQEQPDPPARWSFDSVEELGTPQPPFQLVEGVRGKALVFDGYHTEIACEPRTSPALGNRFTLSAWVAPQEYSWNLSAIINRQQDFQKGWFLGINQTGQLVGSMAMDTGWKTCTSEHPLPLLKWSHVTMVCDAAKGITLYIDGAKAAETATSGQPVPAHDVMMCIGKTQTPMTPARTERKTSQAVRSWMYFDGLIDEIEIRNRALTDAEVLTAFTQTPISNKQPLQYRKMPSGGDEPIPFGACYTKLRYAPGWDALWRGSDLPDVVVRFAGSPVKLVFWRGTGYIPAMVSENGIWMTDQSGENFGSGECFEAMGDKQCRYSHVRIIENTPARAVVHWRYALASISHKIKHETETSSGDWMDEYWTAYPDGVAIRKQVLWSRFDAPGTYQFQETIFFNQPGTKPQDNVEYEAITFMDMNGKKASYSWETGAPKTFPDPMFKPIEMVNFKSKYRPFSIHHPERVTRPFSFGWVREYSTFPCWNHWPVSQIPSDGRNAQAPDKPSHSSLTQVNGDQQKHERFPDGSVRVRSLIGMTTEPVDSLLPLARSWNSPPRLDSRSPGFTSSGYDPYQRAYLFEKQKDAGRELVCEISATPDSPAVNLCLVIKNWGDSPASVRLDGQPVSGDACAMGSIQSPEGDNLVVWLPVNSTRKMTISIMQTARNPP